MEVEMSVSGQVVKIKREKIFPLEGTCVVTKGLPRPPKRKHHTVNILRLKGVTERFIRREYVFADATVVVNFRGPKVLKHVGNRKWELEIWRKTFPDGTVVEYIDLFRCGGKSEGYLKIGIPPKKIEHCYNFPQTTLGKMYILNPLKAKTSPEQTPETL